MLVLLPLLWPGTAPSLRSASSTCRESVWPVPREVQVPAVLAVPVAAGVAVDHLGQVGLVVRVEHQVQLAW
jgi:hypothetical protein